MRKVKKKKKQTAKVTGRERKGGNTGVYWDSSPQLSQNSAEVKKKRHKHLSEALKAYPGWLLSTQKLESLKKNNKQTNREALTGVSPSASHIWSSINAEAPALKPSWSETLPPIKTTYRLWAETGTRQETKHKRDAAEHTGHDAAVCLHLKSCEDGTRLYCEDSDGGALTPMLYRQLYLYIKAINI